MSFGSTLSTTTLTTTLYRKVDADNFLASGELCFSTSNSASLISHGTFCIALEKGEYTGEYTDRDADAGKNFGYDEFRVSLEQDELIARLDAIIVPDSWYDDVDEDIQDTDQDPFTWIQNLEDYGRVISETEAREEGHTVDFNF